MEKRLTRSRSDRFLAGVCGGFGEYFDIDSVIIRLIWLAAFFLGVVGVLAYIIAWIIIPEAAANDTKNQKTEEKKEDKSTTQEVSLGSAKTKYSSGREFFGFALIALGIIILIENFVPWWGLNRLWPIFIIFLGLLMISRASRRGNE
jgi:phage shock protein C